MPAREILVSAGDEGERLDIYLAAEFSDRFSRSQIKKMIESGHILVEGRQVAAHYKVKSGEKIVAEWGELAVDEMRGEDIPLEILHEDEDLLFVNKPAGMVVHPGHGNLQHTLVNALLYHVRGLSSLGGAVRPGIVHRLDKDTSGVMVVAKNDQAHAGLANQFKAASVERIYRVIVHGIVQHQESICEEPVARAFLNRKKIVVQPSGGKNARTYYRVLQRFAKATLLDVQPRTGRTHQIRVHMAHIGHPVLGDELYGMTTPGIERQAVHAFGLGVRHPRTREKLYFEAQLPEDMQRLLAFLESEK